jgi:hypothetical protein
MSEEPTARFHLLSRALLGLLLASIAIGALIGIVMLVVGSEAETGLKIIGTVAVIAGYDVLALAAALVLRRGVLVVLMWLTIVLACVSVGVWMTIIWWERSLDTDAEQLLARFAGTTTVFCVGSLYVAIFAMMKTKSLTLSLVRWGVVGLAVTFGLLLVTLFWIAEILEMVAPQLIMMYVISTFVIGGVAGVGSLVTRVLFGYHERREKGTPESVGARPELTLACPQCAFEQTLPTGNVRCGACGFTMVIEVEEPRCECGYLLFRLAGDTCPECGRPVAAAGT